MYMRSIMPQKTYLLKPRPSSAAAEHNIRTQQSTAIKQNKQLPFHEKKMMIAPLKLGPRIIYYLYTGFQAGSVGPISIVWPRINTMQ